MDSSQITDLRTTLDFLAERPGQLVSTDVEVDPYLEIAGIYAKVGSGTPTAPPTQIGPAMMFNKVKGSDWRVVAGILASRERTALLLGSEPKRLAFDLLEALDRAVPPVVVPASAAPCQEVVIKPPFDLRTVIPAIQSTPKDAGPFFNLGLLRGEDPETGISDVTIHRMCVHGPDTISVSFSIGRHIGVFLEKAWAMGKPLPVSCSIGIDPAIYVATSFEAPTTPLGFDELTIAGGLRNRPVELVDCVTQNAKAIARAETRPRGRVPAERAGRRRRRHRPGMGHARVPRLRGSGSDPVAHLPRDRHHPPGGPHPADPHRSRRGARHPGRPPDRGQHLPAHARTPYPASCKNVYCASAGGGKYLAIMQIKKRRPNDEGMQRQAALVAFTAFAELKHVILVDDDVDIYDASDVMWAMTTRYQGDVDTIFVPGVRGHSLDPSGTPEYNQLLRGPGITCKTIFDCTVPWGLQERFERSQFMDVDLKKYFR